MSLPRIRFPVVAVALLLAPAGASGREGAAQVPQIARAQGGVWVAQLPPAAMPAPLAPDAATAPSTGPVRPAPLALPAPGGVAVAFDLATLAPASGSGSGLVLPTVREGLLGDGR
jgi:hypothetical protein